MGNTCTNHEEKLILLENKIEEQTIYIQELYDKNALLIRENKYLENRYQKVFNEKNIKNLI